jgi:CxxC motif-containing protein
MKTEKELNAAILKTTLIIQEKFPELSKYIEEMPITIPVNNPEVTIKNLTNYNNSLENLIEKYAQNHSDTEGSPK